MPDGRNAAIAEMTTGVDPYPNSPDCGATVWLASDGTVKVYGMNPYYDPNPITYVPASVPSGTFDFIGALTHEIVHSIGIRNSVDFNRHLTNIGGNTFFVGPETVATLGQPLPYVGGGHYGNTSLPDNPIGSGLMFQWGNYEGNHLDIGRLDLAILRDVGLSTKNVQGLPLVDRIDNQIPRNTLSNSVVNENVALGTTVGIVTTSAGSGGFSSSLPWLRLDNRFFRLIGNTLVTNSSFDYETRSSYAVLVRNTDTKGVWTDTVIHIRVNDLSEDPKIVAPARATMSGSLSLGCVGLTGDNSTVVSMAIFSRNGVITSRVVDPAVRVYVVRNTSGGTTAFLVGSIQAISRNTKNLSYSGNDSKLVVDISACIGGVCRNYGRHELELVRGFTVRPLSGIGSILRN
jgi:hypothetical protein